MKKTILYITPGPVYRPKSKSYQMEFRMLSQIYNGYIFTTSSKKEELVIDNFNFYAMKSKYNIISNVKFFLFCIKNSIVVLKKGTKIDLVVTYDPIKSGLIGLFISFIHKAKFAPQVNGVYTSEAEWIDEKDKISTKMKKVMYPAIIRFVLKHADGIKLLFDNQIQPFNDILDGKIIRSFPCYVAVDDFCNMPEKKEVLFAGFPYKRKGVDVLIAAFKKIADKYPEWKLKILGWFPDLTEMNKAISGHGQIYHHLPVHYSEMPEHIGRCAILVLPSRSEAMGRVLVEAMAAGKPRIGSNVDGIPTVINHGIDGLLVEPDNVDDLAEKLDVLMGNEELRKNLGKNGMERVKREFTKEIYFKNISNFYKDVLGA